MSFFHQTASDDFNEAEETEFANNDFDFSYNVNDEGQEEFINYENLTQGSVFEEFPGRN